MTQKKERDLQSAMIANRLSLRAPSTKSTGKTGTGNSYTASARDIQSARIASRLDQSAPTVRSVAKPNYTRNRVIGQTVRRQVPAMEGIRTIHRGTNNYLLSDNLKKVGEELQRKANDAGQAMQNTNDGFRLPVSSPVSSFSIDRNFSKYGAQPGLQKVMEQSAARAALQEMGSRKAAHRKDMERQKMWRLEQ